VWFLNVDHKPQKEIEGFTFISSLELMEHSY